MRKYLILSTLLAMLSIYGCGSEGGAGSGTTVYITAGPKTDSSLSLFTNISSNSGNLEFTVKSQPLVGVSTKIQTSKVQITSVSLSYVPLEYDMINHLISPAFPSNVRNISGIIDTPGENNYNIMVFEPKQMEYARANPALFNFNGTLAYYYTIFVTFNGYEINTNVPVSATTYSPFYIGR